MLSPLLRAQNSVNQTWVSCIVSFYRWHICDPEIQPRHLTFSEEKFMHTAPSLSNSVGNLNESPGTPLITTSLRGTQSFMPHPSFSTTSCRFFLIPSPLVNCCTPVTSTEYTQAPSFANKAASGRPTTSDLFTTVME